MGPKPSTSQGSYHVAKHEKKNDDLPPPTASNIETIPTDVFIETDEAGEALVYVFAQPLPQVRER